MPVEGQVARAEREPDDLRLARRERYLPERLELADGAGEAGRASVGVKLHDLFRGARSAVGDARADRDLAAHRDSGDAERELAVLDPAVGETVTERIKRAVGDASVMRLV